MIEIVTGLLVVGWFIVSSVKKANRDAREAEKRHNKWLANRQAGELNRGTRWNG